MAQSKAVKSHMTKLKNISKRMNTLTTDFNTLVHNSVELLWGEGNGQIALINNTMNALEHLKGADMRALVTYYKQCVPYQLDNDTGRFTSKNKNQFAKMSSTWADFIAENNWYEFSKVKEAKPYNLDIAALIKLIDKKLEKGEENGQVTDEKLDQLATGLSEVLSKHTQHAETVEEMSDKEINEELTAELKAVG